MHGSLIDIRETFLSNRSKRVSYRDSIHRCCKKANFEQLAGQEELKLRLTLAHIINSIRETFIARVILKKQRLRKGFLAGENGAFRFWEEISWLSLGPEPNSLTNDPDVARTHCFLNSRVVIGLCEP